MRRTCQHGCRRRSGSRATTTRSASLASAGASTGCYAACSPTPNSCWRSPSIASRWQAARGASQTDLFALARSGSDLISIAVEGKVAEAFDTTVGEWLDRRAAEQAKRGRTRQPSAQARKRLAYLCELLQLDEGDIRDLRYQLLHRTAAAILEAQRFAAHHALMLVHSFSAEDAWLDDYQAFAQRMGARDADADAIVVVGERGGIPLYLSWIRGEERYARAWRLRPITCSPPRLSRSGCGGVWRSIRLSGTPSATIARLSPRSRSESPANERRRAGPSSWNPGGTGGRWRNSS
jgi:hypothetical protein